MDFTVDTLSSGKRLDVFVSECAGVSRTLAVKLIDEGAVTVDGALANKKFSVKEGMRVSVLIPEPTEISAKPENIPLDIVFEDSDIIVINKPKGMVVHPAPGSESGTLVNALLYHCKDSLSGIGGELRPGIVHRIDKDTSGLLVVAKNDEAHIKLSRELEEHNIVREYHALVRGGFKDDSGTVVAAIGRHPVDRKKMAVLPETSAGARHAVTHYSVNERFDGISYLTLVLETGRTHQIRVHMSHIGHALLGDEVYAKTKLRFEKQHQTLFSGQALHAKRLTLTHPRTNERLTFESELPEEFLRALEILRKENN